MPELPEVTVVTNQLKKHLINKTIIQLATNEPKMFKELDIVDFQNQLYNTQIKDITNIGKHILIWLSNNNILISHLRMEGKYFYYENKNVAKIIKNDHVFFYFSDGSELHYNDSRKFGTFHLRNINNYLDINPLKKLAKVPWDTTTPELFDKTSKSSKKIKTLLLDQSILLGLGNIYVDETLYAAQVHPQTIAKNISLEQVSKILHFAEVIMKKSIELGGSTIDSFSSFNHNIGKYQLLLKVHTKVNQPCQSCQTIIQKIKVNGRGTYFCPKEQKIQK